MKNKLFWRLCAFIGVGTVLLFLALSWLTDHTETSMSFIAQEHQQQLLEYGKQAELILQQEGEAALAIWLQELQRKENTWVAVVKSNITAFAGTVLPSKYIDRFQLGRSVEWKIHLYFEENPTMEIPFSDASSHLLIRLPQRMRPGAFLIYAKVLLQIALPLILLSIFSFVLYQHVMTPLRRLENVTKAFSAGKLEARITPSLPERNDEFTRLATTFDHMAERISQLIYNQRQLLADLSHELRTPLTRIDMAVDFVDQQINPKQALERLRYEASTMRSLVEDSLTLVWLNTESPQLNTDNFDLVELIQVICEDARFEYPDRELITQLPEQGLVKQSSQLALGQAIENIIRNALRYTPEKQQVAVILSRQAQHYHLLIKDQGSGVPEEMLADIFKPFFRVDKTRASEQPLANSSNTNGFGLGLALAQRQVEAVGGTIRAVNYHSDLDKCAGLQIIIELPF
ncbi:histidine kinase sensor domain-containing protein [Paraglaciecola aquimarina]|uniref:histidine kinase n=1 Tax=Paraglaciecola aquimarina TaxID=1235557 RepID=A0ABU3SV82_9ALTE|nr:histidine kinase sensor domain-containing protein [Paraglaciecola aquimarina]MDU0353916.1 histidine kinase sensor domain-containing protein [Paraglaciecola aquimarina]